MPQHAPTGVGPHVAAFAFPFSTHAAPLFAVVRRLAAAAPDTLFSFFSTPESNRVVFSSASVPHNLKAYDVWDGVPQGYTFQGKHQEHIELFMTAAPESFRKGAEAAVAESGRGLSCLMGDAFFWFLSDTAAEMRLPWVPFWTAGAGSLSAHVYTDLIRERIGVQGKEDRALNFVPGLSKLSTKDLPEGIVSGKLDSLFSRMLHQMGQRLPLAATVFINSFEELDTTITNNLKSKFKGFLNVGPLNLLPPRPPPAHDAHGCLPWLDKQNPASVAYISFGSVTKLSPPEVTALADALEASGVPFIWSLKDDLREELPSGFLDRTRRSGMVVPWAPQTEVLAHDATGVFVTHCGWNSLLESVAGGVPMFCRPFFGDQVLNARMAEEVWGIAVHVEGRVLTKDGVIAGLDLVLSGEKGKRLKENVRRLKALAQKATAPNGSSTQNFMALLNIASKLQLSEF